MLLPPPDSLAPRGGGQSREEYLSKLDKRLLKIGGPQAMQGLHDPSDYDTLRKGAAEELHRLGQMGAEAKGRERVNVVMHENKDEKKSLQHENAGTLSLLASHSRSDTTISETEGDNEDDDADEEDGHVVVDREYVLELVDDDASDESDEGEENSISEEYEDIETRSVRTSAARSTINFCEDCSIQ
jgi:hypothetical protein